MHESQFALNRQFFLSYDSLKVTAWSILKFELYSSDCEAWRMAMFDV